MASDRKHRRPGGAGAMLGALLAALAMSAAPAQAAPGDPLFIFSPVPPPLPALPEPPPTGYLNGPCGLAVDSGGRFWVSDHNHRSVDFFSSDAIYEGQPLSAASQANPHTRAYDDPCGLDLDSSDTLYLNNYHRNVARFPSPVSAGTGTVLAGSQEATGVAINPADDHVFADLRDHVGEYDSSGAFVQSIGAASLQDGYGIAVSGFAGTEGFLYLPDAASNTVKVYDPDTDTDDPVQVISGPPGGFTSLVDSSVAVDDASGTVYVLDGVQPANTEEPRGRIQVFSSAGAYQGHLKYDVIAGAPSGIAVDNSGTSTQSRVYVSSGNTHRGAVYAYPPASALTSSPLASKFHIPLLGSSLLFPTVSIGGPGGGAVDCEGDACQILPPEPVDPTLTTLLSGRGNPTPRYRQYYRKGARQRGSKKKGKGGKRRAARASVAGNGLASSVLARETANGGLAVSPTGSSPQSSPAPGSAAVLLPGSAGFSAAAFADGGAAATQAGSHPYAVELSLGLDQSGGTRELKSTRITLPPGLLLNPANGTGLLCTDSAFATPRSTPFAAGSESGESCPDQSQVGTVEVTTGLGGGKTRSFGLFNREPKAGEAARFGAAPFDESLDFSMHISAEVPGANMSLEAEVPQALQLRGLKITLWGAPWDASHNPRRGDCLNEAEPDFGWGRCSVGEPLTNKPRSFITMPSLCGAPLSFQAQASSWQEQGSESADTHSAGPVSGCAGLDFKLQQEGLLSVKKASSATGFVYRFYNEDPQHIDPRGRIQALAKKVTVELPRGVTLNPSVGAGLGTCTPGQLASETAFNPPSAGCPAASKIGVFSVGLPYYTKRLRGSIYLATPKENPFDSLLAVYLVAKSAERDLLFRIPGKLSPDDEGTITATFDDLPQLPYTDLEVNFRSGQRAPLISPPRCGAATAKLTLTPWAAEVPERVLTTSSPIETGVDGGPCPSSTPPFSPGALAGGVNSNVGSYTPYYVKLTRRDTEQEITSYSLVLPKGITGKLAGVPFCPEAAIEAARHKRGFAETASPSCPTASQVGRTHTGYGVGDALTYAPGRIYLAGPYKGSPLSLVTINAATVGPFDLGTIVIRSAFDVDQRTAQLEIDSSASDPIPHIIDGIPLHLREVRIYMDRFQFTHNPSSCEASQLVSRLTGSGATFQSQGDDSVANVAQHFQLLNCLTLGFKPKLGLRLRGPSRRGAFPSLRATFASRGAEDSNLKKIEVEMPHSLFLAQTHIKAVCTKPQFAQESCPEGSIYGKAVARTLLFDEPLRGNVYLRSSDRKLPDLVTDLHSGAVRIVVEGRIGPGKHGGIHTFFDNLPDAPLDYFRMTLRGGAHGLLQNSVDICRNPPLATVSALGQNNIGVRFSSVLRGQCAAKKRAGR